MNGNLSKTLDSRRELVKIIIVVALVGFAINFIASLTFAYFVEKKWYLLAGSIGILCFSLYLYLMSARKLLVFNEIIDAAIIINRNNNRIVPVKGYKFARGVSQIFKAIEAENQAIFGEWEREPLCQPRNQKQGVDQGEKSPSYIAITRVNRDEEGMQPSAALLAEEVCLFSILESLSTHLSSYFGDHKKDGSIKEFSRDDFPEFLMKNRIINLLSTPIEQRPIFIKAFPDPEKRPEGEIVNLWGSDGAVYSRFDLTLPSGSKLECTARNGLRIITKRLSLHVSVRMGLNLAGATPAFCSEYLGVDWQDIEPRKIIIEFSGSINPWYLIRSKGWDLYYWLDSFREELRKEAGFDEFMKSIHWDDIIEPLLFSMRTTKNSPKKPADSANRATLRPNAAAEKRDDHAGSAGR